MNKKNKWNGILSMSFFFLWIMYFPFHGPGMKILAVDGYYFSNIFIVVHILGFLSGGWLYYKGYPFGKTQKRIEKSIPVFIALLTIFLAFTPSTSTFYYLISFAIMGHISGILIIRWAFFLSSPHTANQRGALSGMSIFITYGLLHIMQMILIPLGDTGLLFGLLLSSTAAFIGGTLILKLPIPKGRGNKLLVKDIIPPLPILLFGLLVFILGGLSFHTIIDAHVQYPFLIFFLLLPYITGFILGKMSDQYTRHHLSIAAFIFLGTGFALWTIAPHYIQVILFVQILILSGDVCANLFYWLSLADNESVSTAPVSFALGLAFKLTVYLSAFIAIPHLDKNLLSTQPFMGVLGVILAFIGITILAVNSFRFFKISSFKLVPLFLLTKIAEPSQVNATNKNPKIFFPKEINKSKLAEILKEKFNLSNRELDVAYLILTGYGNSQISETLYISVSTTKFHTRNILKKTSATNRQEFRKIVYNYFDNRKGQSHESIS